MYLYLTDLLLVEGEGVGGREGVWESGGRGTLTDLLSGEWGGGRRGDGRGRRVSDLLSCVQWPARSVGGQP